MKILYAIQGTGNGHICRAQDIIPALQQRADVDILLSGIQADIDPPFDVKYRFDGLSFIFGKKGGIDLYETFKKSRLRKLFREIRNLPVEHYDLVISDFEPVSSWACFLKNKACIALSHQAAVIDKNAPKPKKTDPIGKMVLKGYAPASARYGFHFHQYSDNIFTPVIRKKVREATITNLDHYTVYLPAYSERRIIRVLSKIKDVQWQVFSKHSKQQFRVKNIGIFPVTDGSFIESMASGKGVLCGAGFETPAEALYLGKKLMVIPMKNQFEQQCNAASLKTMGVPVIKSLREKHLPHIQNWILSGSILPVTYPDNTDQIIENILEENAVETK